MAILPGGSNGSEDPVWMIKLSTLQGQEHGREGLEPDQVVEDEGRRRVVRAVVKRRNLEKRKIENVRIQFTISLGLTFSQPHKK